MDAYKPLSDAIMQGNVDTIKQFLDNGGNVNLTNKYNEDLLYRAVLAGNNDIVKLLIDRGALVNKRYIDNQTALHFTVTSDETIKSTIMLIDKGADVNAEDGYKRTPLFYALTSQYKETILTIDLLIMKGANVNDVDVDGFTPLHIAVMSHSIERVQAILENNKANINAMNKSGATPLDVAVALHDMVIAKYLFKNGAKEHTEVYTPDVSPIAPPVAPSAPRRPTLDTQTSSKDLIEFKKNQVDYVVNKLTNNDRLILTSYTRFGDRIVNQVLRGNVADVIQHNPVFISNLKQFMTTYETLSSNSSVGVVRNYVTLFMNVFRKNIPLLDSPLVVYRGVQRREDISIHGNEFLSTSLNKTIAKEFVSGKGCCLLTIQLNPGVRAFWIEPISMYPQEQEVLVGPPFKVEKIEQTDSGYNVVIGPMPVYKRGATRRIKTNKRKRTYKRRI